MAHDRKHLESVVKMFAVKGNCRDIAPYGTGHINDTYLVKMADGNAVVAYILQRINHNIFKNPPLLMENIMRVTGHIRKKLSAIPGSDPDREALTVILTKDSSHFLRDQQGDFWRMYIFITAASTYDICATPQQAYETAAAFGRFQALLADFAGERLHETIPWFHHTPRRFKTLTETIAHDKCNRARTAKHEIDFCLERASLAPALIENGQMPERISHNDAKINNVMIDCASGRGVCVIDIDTVMTGCPLYDFGDLVRTAARTMDEDERNLDKVALNLGLFEALARGYLENTRGFLTPLEMENMISAGKVITFTIGIRFLTDHLLGDVYFKIHRPAHNMDRARVQFKLLACLKQQEEAMQAVIRKYC